MSGRLTRLALVAVLAAALAVPAGALAMPAGAPGADAAATTPKKKKKKKKKKKAVKKVTVTVGKVTVVGFRIAATPKDSLTEIPPIPLTLAGNGTTITSCGSAYPLPVPTDDLWATLIIVTTMSGRLDIVRGTLTNPTGDSTPLIFGSAAGTATAVVAATSSLPLVTENGRYTISAQPSVKVGTKTAYGRIVTGSITISCSRP